MYCANHSSTIADNEALANLTNAIAEAIVKGKSQAEVWASDGEGYSIRIKRVEDELDNKAWNQLPNHYTAEWHFHSTKGCINPQQFWNE